MSTTKKNRYSNVTINVISKNNGEDIAPILTKLYQIVLNSKANAS
jgi:hypothetical protein